MYELNKVDIEEKYIKKLKRKNEIEIKGSIDPASYTATSLSYSKFYILFNGTFRINPTYYSERLVNLMNWNDINNTVRFVTALMLYLGNEIARMAYTAPRNTSFKLYEVFIMESIRKHIKAGNPTVPKSIYFIDCVTIEDGFVVLIYFDETMF